MKTKKKKKMRGIHMANIPVEDIEHGMKQLSSGAFQLLMYYYTKSDGWAFSEKKMCDDLGVKIRTLKEHIKELTDKKFILILKGAVDVYFIGERAVNEYEQAVKQNSVDGYDKNEKVEENA